MLWNDLRFGARSLALAPAFTIVAIFTLALGIGANTAIFSIANALLLRPLPYQDSARLVIVTNAHGVNRRPFSYIRSIFLRDHSRSFQDIAAFVNENFNLTGRGEPEELPAARVAWNFFQVLGVRPALGRTFLPDEDRPGARPAVLISDSLWKRRFGGDPHVIGQSLTLDSVDAAIIGVTPPGFEFAPLGRSIDVWSSRTFQVNVIAAAQIQHSVYLIAVARIRRDVPLEKAQAEMAVLDAQYRVQNPAMPDADPHYDIALNPLQELMVANLRPAVWVLFAAVAFVLLIACANVASLLLSRALTRRKEYAVRVALGASRIAIVRQMLIESVLLAMAGGCLGVFLSLWATRAVALLPPGTLPNVNPVQIDLQVLAFALGLSLLTGVLLGLLPALQFSKPDLQTVLREEGRGSTGSKWRALARSLLVISQVALSTILLVGAGLLIRSFVRLQHVNLGFNPDNVILMKLALPPSRYSTTAQIADFCDRLITQVAATPGVRSVAISSALPLRPSKYGQILPEDARVIPIAQRPIQPVQAISSGYFETMGIPLIAGRIFGNRDNESATPVAIVNDAFARRYWPNGNVIGKRVWLSRGPKPLEVVGIVGNAKNITLAVDPVPEMYYPIAQVSYQSVNLIVRCFSEPRWLLAPVRAQVLNVDKDQPVTDVRTMEQHLAGSIAQNRWTALVLGGFSLIALTVALVGLYGLIAYSVAQRTQELGLRLILGALPADILRMVLRQALSLAFFGVALGLAGSLILTRLMKTLLYHVSATDAWTFATSAVLFLAVALLASYLPARRAARLEPSDALKYE